MDNQQQRDNSALVFAILLWIGTWALMIPIPNSLAFFPDQVLSLWGVGYLIVPPYTKLGSQVDRFIAYHSFYIGLLIMLMASGIVVLASGKSRRVTRLVVIVDALILAIWVIVSWP
jgi:hypothetical protein